jgi:hypothetical protein
MAEEPLIAPAELQPPEPITVAGVEHPAPTADQEQLADDVFTPGQEKAAAAFLGVHMGLGLLHHIVVEAAGPAEEEEPKRKKRERPGEEEEDDEAAG